MKKTIDFSVIILAVTLATCITSTIHLYMIGKVDDSISIFLKTNIFEFKIDRDYDNKN